MRMHKVGVVGSRGVRNRADLHGVSKHFGEVRVLASRCTGSRDVPWSGRDESISGWVGGRVVLVVPTTGHTVAVDILADRCFVWRFCLDVVACGSSVARG